MALIRFTLLALKCGDYRKGSTVDLDEHEDKDRVAQFRADQRWSEGQRLAGFGVPVERQPVPSRAVQLREQLMFALSEHALKVENAPFEVQDAYARELRVHGEDVEGLITRALALRRLEERRSPVDLPDRDRTPPDDAPPAEPEPPEQHEKVLPEDLQPEAPPPLPVVSTPPPDAHDLGTAPPPAAPDLPDLPETGPVVDLLAMFAGGAVPKKAEALMGAEDAGIPITGALRGARVAELPALIRAEIAKLYKIPEPGETA